MLKRKRPRKGKEKLHKTEDGKQEQPKYLKEIVEEEKKTIERKKKIAEEEYNKYDTKKMLSFMGFFIFC